MSSTSFQGYASKPELATAQYPRLDTTTINSSTAETNGGDLSDAEEGYITAPTELTTPPNVQSPAAPSSAHGGGHQTAQDSGLSAQRDTTTGIAQASKTFGVSDAKVDGKEAVPAGVAMSETSSSVMQASKRNPLRRHSGIAPPHRS
ncbi:hypothetical protein C8Q76DRAFT_782073 [Earliella scabrosa]|nr:hypothetical protein C8Q76DRAFT_782073 [Earliella scabrosa]